MYIIETYHLICQRYSIYSISLILSQIHNNVKISDIILSSITVLNVTFV